MFAMQRFPAICKYERPSLARIASRYMSAANNLCKGPRVRETAIKVFHLILGFPRLSFLVTCAVTERDAPLKIIEMLSLLCVPISSPELK